MQFLGLLTGGEGVDDVVQIAVHDLVEVVYRQADPVVGAAILREVVGPELLSQVPSLSSLLIELYIPKYFFAHAASLHQGFPHCAIFPTAASRRSLNKLLKNQ